ncbi:ATPase synthesis protein 25, mitochondrial [Aspergillus aurantiobrunneus]
MMNRTLLRAPRRCQGVTRILPSISSATPRYTFLTCGRVRTLASTSHLSIEHPASTPGAIPPEEKATKKSQSASEPSQHIPWYLQEESSVPATAEVTSRDQLPELPENPPKILPELLEYVFKDLGLDGLKLLDLRGLETPSALGANVIMIIGTARSVKHLNVSADRLCRWLRSTYKLSPYADGLLGRNELKIKLRRKTRRARVASRTGAMFDDKDDGIITGWICVNAGVVEKAPVQEQVEGEFEGFGPLVGGTRVVVQLFTEEKRAELDLEGLWEGRLERAQQEKDKNSDVAVDAPEEVRSPNSIHPSPSDYESPRVPRSPASLPLEQRRQFHSKSRYTGPRHWHNVVITRQLMSQTHTLAESAIKESPGFYPSSTLLQNLSALPDEELKSALGDNPVDDHNSTDFLRKFYNGLSEAPLDILALAQLELMCFAFSRGHTRYSRESIYRAFMGCCISASQIPERVSTQVLDILLSPRTREDSETEEWFSDSDKEMALSVLDQLILRGNNFMTLQMFTRLYSLACLPRGPGEEGEISPADKGSHVLRMIDTLDIPFDPVEARRLMLTALRNGDHVAFWKWWRKLPLHNSPRNYKDYEILFRMHAELGDERQARECLTNWVPMMSREDPPIPLQGELVRYIQDCLIVAEPRIEALAAEGSKGSLARLWRECEAELEG